MRETQQNIKRYEKQLSHLKSKIAAAGLFFVMSFAMLTTASFAWLVLSINPEISNISTTIAGNGNLEIALGHSDEAGNLLQPEKSEVGDSRKELLDRNITWGNLVNLNDPSYGLQAITLRPASLNEGSLLTSPLSAVDYGNDGRPHTINSNFYFTNFDKDVGADGRFLVKDITNYGVRAISNITYEDTSLSAGEQKLLDVENLLGQVKGQYAKLVSQDKNVNDKQYVETITGLMGTFITGKVNKKENNEIKCTQYMVKLYEMMEDFYKCYEDTELLYLASANAQFISKGKPTISLTEMQGKTQSEIETLYAKDNVKIYMNGYDDFLKDMKNRTNNNLKFHLEDLHDEYLKAQKNQDVYWSDIVNAVNFMIDFNSCTVADAANPGKVYSISDLSMDTATKLINANKFIGTVKNGAIKNYEQLIGQKMNGTGLTIKVTLLITVEKNADIATTAKAPYTFNNLINQARAALGTGNKSAVAGDVYGMVLDFFVRTNSENSYLTLEGEAKTEQQPLMINDIYYCYEDNYGIRYYHEPDPQATTDLSKGRFYFVDNAKEKQFSEGEREEFIKEIDLVYKTVIVGYDGVNRVWEEGEVDKNSSTQGKGSCYIFYPEDPNEQDLTLELLDAMSIAFVGKDGLLLAQADFNTKNAFIEPTKVTVPIELRTTGNSTTNEDGEAVYYISELTKGEAQFISAIVYLDGMRLTNADVSAENYVDGYLNLQFGSSNSLENMDDLKLRHEKIDVSATIEKTSFSYNPTTPSTTRLTVNITGITPKNNVKAIFTRQVNSSQGVKQEPIILEKDTSTETTWFANPEFALPGKYVLRSVWIDGIEYNLIQPIEVTVDGIALSAVNIESNLISNANSGYAYLMTDQSSIDVGVSIAFASDATYKPKNVQAVFKGEGTTNIYADLAYKGDKWQGNALFSSSGSYTLDYLLVDGEYYAIDEGLQKTIKLVLGVKATVQLSETSYKHDYKNPGKTITVYVYLYDNVGNALTELEDISVQYILTTNPNISLDAKLQWDDENDAYIGVNGTHSNGKPVGKFYIDQPGIYSLNQINIGTGNNKQTITNASAPNITVINPEPVEYVGFKKDEFQFAPDNSASFVVNLKYSDSATVKATLVHNNSEYEAVGTKGNKDDETNIIPWTFTIPSNNNGTDIDINGEWKLTKLTLANVVYNKKDYGADNPLTLSMNDKNISTYVVKDIKVNLSTNDHVSMSETVFTNTLSGTNNDYIIPSNAYTLSITDKSNNPETINELIKSKELTISNMKLSYSLINVPSWWENSTNYLDQKGSNYDANKVIPSSEFVVNAENSTVYNNSTDITFYYPGTYLPTLKFKLNGKYPISISLIEKGNGNTVSYDITKTNYEATESSNETDLSFVKVDKDTFVTKETVAWSRPHVNFTKVTTDQGNIGKFNTTQNTSPDNFSLNPFGNKCNAFNTSGCKFTYVQNENKIDMDKNSIDVWFRASGSGILIDFYASKAEAELFNGGNQFKKAEITIDSSEYDVTYTFSPLENLSKNPTNTQSIGEGHNGYKKIVSSGAQGKTIVFTTKDDQTYNFGLDPNKYMTVNANNGGGY